MDYTLIAQFALFATFSAVILFFSIRSTRKAVGNQKNAMQNLAAALGLPVKGGEPVLPNASFLRWIRKPLYISDKYDGKQLLIYHVQKSTGKNNISYATIEVKLDAKLIGKSDLRMSISAIGWMSKISLGLGRKPIVTGDETFDKIFAVKAHDENLAQALFMPEIRAEFIRVWDVHDVKGTIKVGHAEIGYEELGRLRTDAQVRRFHALSLLIVKMARIIDTIRSMEKEEGR